MKIWALAVTVGCSFVGTKGSGTAKTEVRQVTGFSAVELAGSFDVEVAIGAPRVELSGDDNLLPLIATEVTGDNLVLRSTENMRPSVPLVAKVTVPRLTGLKLAGSGTVTFHGVTADALAVSLKGSGTIRGDGTAKELRADLAGSGDLEIAALAVERATVALTGSGDIDVAASKALDVRLEGSGTVKYHGSPELKKSVAGSGEVVKK